MSAITDRIVAGVNSNTYQEMQLGVGVLVANFDYENIDSVEDFYQAYQDALLNNQSLGGTRGGINVGVVPEMRQREVDGVLARFVGDSVIDRWECYIECDLLQFSPEIMKQAFPTAEFVQSPLDAEGRRITGMRIRTAITAESHIQNMCWIATTDYGMFMFALHNALGQTTGAMSAAGGTEGTIPFRADGFVGDFIADPTALDYAPCEIWFVDRLGHISRDLPSVVSA